MTSLFVLFVSPTSSINYFSDLAYFFKAQSPPSVCVQLGFWLIAVDFLMLLYFILIYFILFKCLFIYFYIFTFWGHLSQDNLTTSLFTSMLFSWFTKPMSIEKRGNDSIPITAIKHLLVNLDLFWFTNIQKVVRRKLAGVHMSWFQLWFCTPTYFVHRIKFLPIVPIYWLTSIIMLCNVKQLSLKLSTSGIFWL